MRRRRRRAGLLHGRAWHDAQMARGSLGPEGWVAWDLVQYESIARLTNPKLPGGKAPDHKALLRRGWRLYHKLAEARFRDV